MMQSSSILRNPLILSITLSSVFVREAFCFSPSSMKSRSSLIHPKSQSSSPSATSSNSISSSSAQHVKLYSEDDAADIMEKAKECAFSDTCSVDDINLYLKEVVTVQGSCAAGVLSAESLCENVDQTATIVATLREKLEASELVNMEMASSTGEGKYSLLPVYIAAAGLSVAIGTALNQNTISDGALPFTVQEWMWAIRDGYLDTMVAAYLKTGGLAAAESTEWISSNDMLNLPFTSQEWYWAARDGYLNDMISAFVRNGGL